MKIAKNAIFSSFSTIFRKIWDERENTFQIHDQLANAVIFIYHLSENNHFEISSQKNATRPRRAKSNFQISILRSIRGLTVP